MPKLWMKLNSWDRILSSRSYALFCRRVVTPGTTAQSYGFLPHPPPRPSPPPPLPAPFLNSHSPPTTPLLEGMFEFFLELIHPTKKYLIYTTAVPYVCDECCSAKKKNIKLGKFQNAHIIQTFHCGPAQWWKDPSLFWSLLLSGRFENHKYLMGGIPSACDVCTVWQKKHWSLKSKLKVSI